MNRRVPVSFLGPVITVAGAGAYFEVLSAQGGVLKLEYPNTREAKKARHDLGPPSPAYLVPNKPLFEAMKQLIHEKEEVHAA